jgi:hypothetical protein
VVAPPGVENDWCLTCRMEAVALLAFSMMLVVRDGTDASEATRSSATKQQDARIAEHPSHSTTYTVPPALSSSLLLCP